MDYGRPAKRGRKIFERGALGDTLWRTGANAATQFRTSDTLDFGGAVIPPGTYTLWTHFGAGHVELIVKTQSGQWGTLHDSRQDFARIQLGQETLTAMVEIFTIRVEPAGDRDGLLILF